jgi:prepilin-type processing-associated H-X9-DG protein
LFPVFGRARENARRASCQSNLKQIGLGIMQYVQDYDECYPLSRSQDYAAMVYTGATSWGEWKLRTYPYVKSTQVYTCPSAASKVLGTFRNTPFGDLTFAEICSYGVNEFVFADGGGGAVNPIRISQLGKTSEMAMVADATYPTWNNPNRVYNANYTSNPNSVPNAIDSTLARHLEGSVIVFADGHAKYWTQTQMGPLVANPNANQYGLPYYYNDPRLK